MNKIGAVRFRDNGQRWLLGPFYSFGDINHLLAGDGHFLLKCS